MAGRFSYSRFTACSYQLLITKAPKDEYLTATLLRFITFKSKPEPIARGTLRLKRNLNENSVSIMSEFQRDAGNIKHIVEDHPDCDNSTSEVESISADTYVQIKPSRPGSDGEEWFQAVGLSNRFRVCPVVFVVRNGQIQFVTCWPSKAKVRNEYAQYVQKKKQESDGRD